MEIKARMPGKVEAINVNVGDKVEKGQKVIVCEAMKMKNPIPSPCDGTVTAIKVVAGARINAGDVLLIIE
ncbi:acetyl-CoA carboxylase [Desulfuromonas soudanensis]|uniref:Acetyl-CoA carboxylase n=1 Tax=Desulfuromonas soudanensis TaxID=1603606 RepID=A0A0M4D054_9BACT|nr:acetyl-CoA carboxylase [Desulfuromonas soudanensis]